MTPLRLLPPITLCKKPDTELAKYLEFAGVNRALGKCTKSQRREELQSVLAVTNEALFYADTLTSDCYNELAAECNCLIQDDNFKAAKRALQQLVVPQHHAKHRDSRNYSVQFYITVRRPARLQSFWCE